jgi:DNA-binding CsgD family transcriptional regulator
MLAFGSQNPVGWRRFVPGDGAQRLSARVRPRDLARLEFYNEFMRPNGLSDTVKVWLWSDVHSAACIQLWRHGGQFPRRAQDLLGVLQQDLVRLRGLAMTGAFGWSATASLTARETEMLLWAVRGHSHADIAALLGTSEGTVGKHLEHAYGKLGVRSRAQAVDRILFSGPAAATGEPTEPN